MNGWIWAILQLYRSAVVKREDSQTLKHNMYQSVYIPILVYDQEKWKKAREIRSCIQTTEIHVLYAVYDLCF